MTPEGGEHRPRPAGQAVLKGAGGWKAMGKGKSNAIRMEAVRLQPLQRRELLGLLLAVKVQLSIQEAL